MDKWQKWHDKVVAVDFYTLAWISCKIFISIMVVCGIALAFGSRDIIGPLGASCGLVFTSPRALIARPRHIFFGHLLSALVGVLFVFSFGVSIWVIAGAGLVAVFLMEWTHTVHPPACATSIIAVVNHVSLSFAVHIAVGAVAIIAMDLVFAKLHQDIGLPVKR